MLIHDYQEVSINSHGQHWMTSWHPPMSEPSGKNHGSAGICVTPNQRLLLISSDGQSWDLPGGRPEAGEDWEQTLRREVLEEACAIVRQAHLLGFSRGRCVGGTEKGLILVRSIWRAEVELLEWRPEFEINRRKVVCAAEARALLSPSIGPIWDRAFSEAGFGRAAAE